MTRLILIFLFLLLIIGCNNNSRSKKKLRNRTINGITLIEYTVNKTYPHSIDSYTEGLLFHDNKLFESTGSPENFPNARSVIGIVDLNTGKIDVKIEIDKKYFGEGILFFSNKLYQLTYKKQLGFIYDAQTFKQIGTFNYSNKEGWGMTTDGSSIIMSDGTNFISYWNPDSLKEIKKLNITYNGASALFANELEYINGFIYANIWTTNYIAKIDPVDGKIVGLIDLSDLFLKAKNENPHSEATNGIAYNPKNDKILVTGKFWPYIFEIGFRH
jgi:glutaminyl-peptide cyclotransferase